MPNTDPMGKNSSSIRCHYLLSLAMVVFGLLSGCATKPGTSQGLDVHGSFDLSARNRNKVYTDQDPDSRIIKKVNGKGCVITGFGELPTEKSNSALCAPNISGPHQWPLRVATDGSFYPDPTAVVDVKVERTDSTNPKDPKDGKRLHPFKTVITVYGNTEHYPGQDQ